MLCIAMPRVTIGLLVLCLGSSAAFAQAEPMNVGPPGTPITPPQIGHWIFASGISGQEAAYDAGLQGYRAVHGLHRDREGDWIGQSPRGAFIVFPDGRAYAF